MSTLFNHIPFLKLEISQVHLAKRGLKSKIEKFTYIHASEINNLRGA